jgi:hypothetical protein
MQRSKVFPFVLALVSVLCAFGAPVAYGEGEEFGAEKYPTTLSATASNHVMTIEGLSLKCQKTTLSGEIVEAQQKLELTPSYNECTALGMPATVSTAGCKYRLEASSTSLDIVCQENKKIVITAGLGACEIQLGGQSKLQKVSYENSAGSPVMLTMTFSLASVKYTVTKASFLCPLKLGERTNASYAGTAQLQIYDAAPAIVSLGDSYISGEGGRWAGNTALVPPTGIDTGSSAYEDAGLGKGELIPLCHRSQSAEIFIGGPVKAVNFACSGALTMTTGTNAGQAFKPGIDSYQDAQGREGQVGMLKKFAQSNNVKMIALSIGGNDFNFATTLQACVVEFLAAKSSGCRSLANIKYYFSQENVAIIKPRIRGAIENIATAMDELGYKESKYTILVQNYPSPIPLANGFRYGETYAERVNEGGCPIYNEDATWMNGAALSTINTTVWGAAGEAKLIRTGALLQNVKFMELAGAFNGRRLCETGVNLLEKTTGGVGGAPLKSWNEPGATGEIVSVNETEWVNQIRIKEQNGYLGQESMHPNYWGQLAIRNCLRQAYNNGSPKGGTCTRAGNGLKNSSKNYLGEPYMQLTP